MSSFTNPLNSIKVASPCSANWDEMIGNNRQRFCGECKLNVYNLSGMSQGEAEGLLRNSEGRLCARFFRRADGSIITQDCPVGWAAVKKRMSRVWTAVASVLLTMFAGIGMVSLTRAFTESNAVMGKIPIERPYEQPLMGAIAPELPGANDPTPIMGDVVMPEDYPEMGKIAGPDTATMGEVDIRNQ